MVKDPQFRHLGGMINKSILKTFRAIFLHLPPSAVAQALGISEDRMIKIIDTPHKHQFLIFFKIGEILSVSEWDMLQLIYAQSIKENKKGFEKHFAKLIRNRKRRLAKKALKKQKQKQ